jgi:hypothetical protein
MNALMGFLGLVFTVVVAGVMVGLGWLVLQPLGRIRSVHITRSSFQLVDLFWLTLLLQPSLAAMGWLINDRYIRFEGEVIGIFVLIWGITVAAWAGMTAALSHVGVNHALKRAAAVLVILPMVAAVIPVIVWLNIVAAVNMIFPHAGFRQDYTFTFAGVLTGDAAFIAAIFGSRRLARWIANGTVEGEPK